ncbi:aspartic peptidase domain-containing protein [Jimgerdemannia flammicorona]|uniref:Aspartic peptidase domain-containing protein n=1 Tax=Jimgerdemannia flammicorona TaxID=994334 RepID=A0A433DGM4_9FUNG|nr:aspartic peptidase domain-containing protein [Jimgerdemannia flammicorona]
MTLNTNASVSVGTPAKTFKLDFDTGSSDMWFPYTGCKSTCSGKTIYDPTKSSTYKKDDRAWSIAYGDGSTSSSILATDMVNLGEFQIQNQVVEMASTISASFQSDPIDGLLGLAFDSITIVAGIKTSSPSAPRSSGNLSRASSTPGPPSSSLPIRRH